MARVDDFDAFYHATRRPLLHQTYALAGDAERAAASVEHAFAHAWSQWRKVRRLPDPAAWVRNEAWRATRGPRPRRRRLGRRITPGPAGGPQDSRHREALDALCALPDAQRRVIVLHHLAEQPVDRIAHELGVSESAAASLLVQGQQAWGRQTHAEEGSLGNVLSRLEEDVAGVRLTRASMLRRSGERRHRHQTLAGVAAAAALVVGGGLLIVNDTPASMERAAATATEPQATAAGAPQPQPRAAAAGSPEPQGLPAIPAPFLLDAQSMLTSDEVGALARPAGRWQVTSTTDGTTGNPLYAPCQQQPFADPDGKQALVRRFATDDGDMTAVQAIEESRSEAQGAKAFATMEDWYARCADDGVQLLSTKTVKGLGDQARAFQLREFGRRDAYLTVGLVRTGPITSAVVASSKQGHPLPAERVLDRAAVFVTRTCLPVSGDCSAEPRVSEAAPLPAQEHPGFLSAFDLPKISDVNAPWVGTDPARTPDDPAATPCERATFRTAQRPRTRVFVLPTAKEVPRRFGLSETVGTFDGRAKAREFIRRAYASVKSCTDRELSASQPRVRELPEGYDGRAWRFEFEVTKSNSVFYRVGLVRTGRRVALVSMSPSEAYDVRSQDFTRLVVRAAQRLAEAR
jgi:DNA-directed RNA polymerase specialized sigma24 family protein